MPKLDFQQSLLKKLADRRTIIKQKLSKFDSLNAELKQIENAIRSLGGDIVREPITEATTDLHYNEGNNTPLSTNGITHYNRLPFEFKTEDLISALNNNRTEAYQWVAAWKRKGWIDTIGRGLYRKKNSQPIPLPNAA